MKRTQLFLVVGVALLLVVGLLALPTGIIRNNSKPAAGGATRDGNAGAGAAPAAGEPVNGAAGAGEEAAHAHAGEGGDHAAHRELTAADRQEIARLRAAYAREAQPAERARRAAELAARLAHAQVFDSAGYYYEQAAAGQPGVKYARLAADQYFEALGFAATPERQQELAKKTQGLYQRVLEVDPKDLAAKTNLAMTYVASPQPMQGILMLREVVAADPTNEQALYNLGILSLQSGQTDKAVGRFQELVKAHPEHVNGHFYLGVALARLGKGTEARSALERTLTLSKDPSLRASVEQELAKLPR